ncbi:MAG TPA: hypothetical protein V6C65_23300 [Allocoleopsis sp.]
MNYEDDRLEMEISQDLRDLENYIKVKIEESFPEITVESFFRYDLTEEDELVGIFNSQSGFSYCFSIPRNSPYPLLKRVASIEQVAAKEAAMEAIEHEGHEEEEYD